MQRSGIYFNARGRQHKVFRGMAGGAAVPWAGSRPLAALAAGLQGKMFGDKGYIFKEMMQPALAAGATLDHWHSPRYEEPPHATDGQALAAQALHHRDPSSTS